MGAGFLQQNFVSPFDAPPAPPPVAPSGQMTSGLAAPKAPPPSLPSPPPQAPPASDTAPAPPPDAGGGAVPPAASPPHGGDGGKLTPQEITAYFVGKGLSPAQAQGVAAAVMGESGGDPTAYNPAGGGIGAYGVAQDRADRQRRLISLYGPTPTGKQQLDFIWYELNTSEKGALAALKQTDSADAARSAFSAHFERPGLRTTMNAEIGRASCTERV